MKDKLSPAGCCIDVLCEALKANATLSKIGDGVNKVSEGAS
jgi:hypothetical protein